MVRPALPGTELSPFDPSPWPPWERVAAAGLGEVYGAIVRQFDREIGVDAFDPVEWAQSHIYAAQQQGTISAQDAARLSALVAPAADGPPPSAAQLLAEAMDDPAASPVAIGVLSIAAYKAEHAVTDDASDVAKGWAFGVALALSPPTVAEGALAGYVAAMVAEHVHITIT